MVAVTYALNRVEDDEAALALAATGLDESAKDRLRAAYELSRAYSGDRLLGTGEPVVMHGLAMAIILAGQGLDLDTRLAALLFDISSDVDEYRDLLEKKLGTPVAELVQGIARLSPLRVLTQGNDESLRAQTEVLRKMLLAMVEDIRVVLLRLASRVRTLRWLTEHESSERFMLARESLDIYAPLANRLGLWSFKWELEDLSFRFLEPDTYKRIAKMLEERRVEREAFIVAAVGRLQQELSAIGIEAEVYGRPKHIYSIWNKMRAKKLDFSKVYDVRAMRVIVGEVKDCYAVLGLVHQLWQPVNGEFDDYIIQPKGNNYRSLHTAVIAHDGRALEVQIRTREMHEHAELGVAAHWRYKEAGSSAKANGEYDEKIALLRSLLSWRDEVTDGAQWVAHFKQVALDDTIYVLTPQGRVVDLPRGATPIDFAYRLHTDIGHRCRGARVDGQLVTLNTALMNGQRVEVVVAKTGGPSRDWLNASQGYLISSSARRKVKQWFATQDMAETLAQGRMFIAKELQRNGQTQANLEDLAQKLGFRDVESMYTSAGHGELGPRMIQTALRGESAQEAEPPEIVTRRSKAGSSQVLIVGVDKLLTQLGRCCKPAPPDTIAGFITRGKGISIHRSECVNFHNMAMQNPERVITAEWGPSQGGAVYAIDITVEATDRQGLLRDISEVFSKERINLTAVNTLSRGGLARMKFTVEVPAGTSIARVLTLLGEIPGVAWAKRL